MLASYYQLITSRRKHADDFAHYYNNLLLKKADAYQDLSTKCRVCLQEGFSSIYGKENAGDTKEALQIFGNIVVSEEDTLTKLLCSNCYKFIEQAIAFRKVALRSEALLKNPVKQKINQEVKDDQYSDNNIENEPKEQEFIAGKPEKHQDNSKVTCNICHKVLNRAYFKEHVTMHDPNHKRFVCDVCGKSFRLRCAYYNHSLRHRTGFPYKCEFCPYQAQYGGLLRTHMRTHTGDYRYMCTECPARFLVKSNLNSHMLKHKDPQFKCDTCKRAFRTKPKLQRHYQCDHLGIKNHICNICGKAFGYRSRMMTHQRSVHKREKILYGRMPTYLQAENKKK